jgi:hypothetical protein
MPTMHDHGWPNRVCSQLKSTEKKMGGLMTNRGIRILRLVEHGRRRPKLTPCNAIFKEAAKLIAGIYFSKNGRKSNPDQTSPFMKTP